MFNMISYLGNIKLSSVRMAVINKTNHSACWWGYELRKAYSFFLELCINTATWKQCRDSYLKESRQIYNRVICTCVYLCVVHNIQGKKPVYLSTITWLEKENTVYIENRILPSPKKQCYAICRKMNQIIYHHVNSNKKNSEKQIPGVFYYMWELDLEIKVAKWKRTFYKDDKDQHGELIP